MQVFRIDQLHYCSYFFCFFISGQEFLVMYHMSELQFEDTDVVFLCLLCERTLLNEESYAHVFSREHVTSFLVSIFICFSFALFFSGSYYKHPSLTQVICTSFVSFWETFQQRQMSKLSSYLILQVKSSQSRSDLSKIKTSV